MYDSINQRIKSIIENSGMSLTAYAKCIGIAQTSLRDCVVNAFYLGVPSEVIMSWTGHKNFASMKPYLKIVDNLKAREMDKFKRPESPGTDLGD